MLIPPGPTRHPMMIRATPHRIAPRMIERIPAVTRAAARIHNSSAAPELRCAATTSMVHHPPRSLLDPFTMSVSRSRELANGGPWITIAGAEGSLARSTGITVMEVSDHDRDDHTHQEYRRHRGADRAHARRSGHDGVRRLHALGPGSDGDEPELEGLLLHGPGACAQLRREHGIRLHRAGPHRDRRSRGMDGGTRPSRRCPRHRWVGPV